MKEEEADAREAINYILGILSQEKPRDIRERSVARDPTEIYASAEEGARLIHSFVRIKDPELRAAITKLAAQLAEF